MNKGYRTKLLTLFLCLKLGGCYSCLDDKLWSDLDENTDQNAKTYPFAIELSDLNNKKYDSSLSIILQNNSNKEFYNEKIQAIGKTDSIYLKKKLDSSHFFEIVIQGHKTAIKDKLGPWCNGIYHHDFYEEIVKDSINHVGWLIKESGLQGNLKNAKKRNGQLVFEFNNVTISPNAPLMSLLKNKHSWLNDISTALVNGEIATDENGHKLVYGLINILIISSDKSAQVHLSLTTKLLSENTPIVMPEVLEENMLSMPVNLNQQFKELLNKLHGEFNNE